MLEEKSSASNPDYDGFKNCLKNGADKLNNIPKKESIKIISHLDADGICAASILISAFIKVNRKYSLTILPTVTEESLINLVDENEKYFVFVDLGSGSLDIVGKVLTNKEIFILDHHILQSEINYPNITQMNPHMFNIDGSDEVSGSGVVFLFSQELTNGKNIEMSKIAIVGAIGDIQENNGFKRINSEILNIAVSNKFLEVKRGLKFFGLQTKPLYKILQYSSDTIIPGVTGSESGSIQFLNSLGINPKDKKGWRKISDLSEEEKKKLIAGIIMKRNKEDNPGDIFCNTYLLVGEDENSPFRDAKEFATLLNSCGRLNKASIGIGACLNDKKMKELSEQNLLTYRKQIVNAMSWYKDNSNSKKVIKGKNYLIINAEEDIMPTMIGTFSSILSKSNDLDKNMFILSLARNYDNTTKVSLRVTTNSDSINLKDIITNIVNDINHGVAGGHNFASGAVIDTDYEDKFIDSAISILNKIQIE